MRDQRVHLADYARRRQPRPARTAAAWQRGRWSGRGQARQTPPRGSRRLAASAPSCPDGWRAHPSRAPAGWSGRCPSCTAPTGRDRTAASRVAPAGAARSATGARPREAGASAADRPGARPRRGHGVAMGGTCGAASAPSVFPRSRRRGAQAWARGMPAAGRQASGCRNRRVAWCSPCSGRGTLPRGEATVGIGLVHGQVKLVMRAAAVPPPEGRSGGT